LAKKAASSGHCVDVLVGCLDQVGIQEMKAMVNSTGGVMVMADGFNTTLFKQNCQKIFEKNSQGYLQMAFNATMDVHLSKELKVCGLVGPAVSLSKAGSSVSETEIGVGGTSTWKLCSIFPKSTFAFYFEIANQVAPS
jgi:protein transport protein SEC23